ncbi:MAG: aminotransferase class V-fold PLP-dependent enzyme [Bacteroidales bacterium]|nr:aminotransferase class V-fold PLP-dependent enzyme [Candidatus Cryptobacteroides aphodequi]
MKPLFYSDYLEGAHPSIIKALADTNFEQTPGYGEDAHCAHAADLIRKACNLPGAEVHFLVGGTQTNATVISSILKPWQGVLCSDCGHIGIHETGAIEHGGHKVLPLPSKNGKITASQIALALELHHSDPSSVHTVQPGMVYISFSTELGTLYTKDELKAIAAVCHEAGIPLYVDGARLGYGLASAECDMTLAEFAAIPDIFYIGGTKQGALFGEAVVINNPTLGKDFRYAIKQNGAMLAKGRLLGIQFESLFSESEEKTGLLYLALAGNADAQAAKIKAAALAAGIALFGDSPTNQVFLIADRALEERIDAVAGYEFWQKYDEERNVIRLCTSWATSDEAVAALISAF